MRLRFWLRQRDGLPSLAIDRSGDFGVAPLDEDGPVDPVEDGRLSESDSIPPRFYNAGGIVPRR